MKHYASKVFLTLVLIYTSSATFAQLQFVDVNSNNNMVRFLDPSTKGKPASNLSYNDVSGKYFWSENWYPALITMKAGKETKLGAARINLYTNDIHFIDKGNEMSARTNKVKKIILYSDKPSDSTTVVGTFESFVSPGTSSEALFEAMSEGQLRLMKRVSITVKKEAFDPLTGKDRYTFVSSTDYFIHNGTGLKVLKSLNKSSVFEAVPDAASSEPWLSSNKNKLKKPDDIVKFLAYLNSQNK
jgi:hypothetical protein